MSDKIMKSPTTSRNQTHSASLPRRQGRRGGGVAGFREGSVLPALGEWNSRAVLLSNKKDSEMALKQLFNDSMKQN